MPIGNIGDIGHIGRPGDDAGGWHWIPGRGWVWFPPWRPDFGFGPPLGDGPSVGIPPVDGGWPRGETHPVVTYLDALRASLDDRSDGAFARALQAEDHAATLTRLHKRSCASIRAQLALLQGQLHEPGANKGAILRKIAVVLEEMDQYGC